MELGLKLTLLARALWRWGPCCRYVRLIMGFYDSIQRAVTCCGLMTSLSIPVELRSNVDIFYTRKSSKDCSEETKASLGSIEFPSII